MRKSFITLRTGVALGAMTAAERVKGRYMRAPDGHDDGGFAEFAAAGDVEVGKPAIETNEPEPAAKPPKAARSGRGPKEPAKAAAPAAKETPAAKAAAEKAAGKGTPGEGEGEGEGDDETGDGEGEGDDEDEDEDGEEKPAKARKKASERIQQLTRERRADKRLIEQLSSRLDNLEKGGLPTGTPGGKSAAIGNAPDPLDVAKYPLGHLDERYVEDKLEWLATREATKSADAVLQRQQEAEQQARAAQVQTELLGKVDDLATRGAELYDDYQEAVVESGMRGDWDLSQATFEAAHEAEHGAQILYDLSQDTKEATRVSKLSTFAQAKYVLDKNAELTAKLTPRKIPGAGAPPSTQTRGANSRSRISPATDNLNDFEKAWAADAKG